VQGFILEILFPTGWRRNGQILWRYGDAIRESTRVLAASGVRGIRILTVSVHPEAIHERIAEQDMEVTNV
jgi:hypothetical protein